MHSRNPSFDYIPDYYQPIDSPFNSGSFFLPPPNPDPQPCPICTTVSTLVSTPTCLHSFCSQCLSTYLELKISEAQVLTLPCPQCPTELPQYFIEQNISPDLAPNYHRFLEIKQLEKDIFVEWCPKPDCRGYDTATTENYNLTCNSCGLKYCYQCSKPWHRGKCKVKKDISFELWAMANNVKICPRCKNHVQKNGGCPHMYCPRCQHRWCWICGGDYSSPDHNTFTCYFGKTPLDLYWGVITFMLLFPLMTPFFMFLMIVYAYETESFEKEKFNGVLSCFQYRLVAYLLALLFSPLVEVVGVVLLYFVISFTIALKNNYNGRGCVDMVFRIILGNMLCNVLFLVAGLLFVVLLVLMPVLGVFFLVTKLYYSFLRCFRPRPVFEYPRLFG